MAFNLNASMQITMYTKDIIAAGAQMTQEGLKKWCKLIVATAKNLAPRAETHIGSYKSTKNAISYAVKQDWGASGLTHDEFKGRVFTTNGKAVMLEFGTGLSGPYHRMIVPKKKRLMRFQVTGSSRYVFAARTRGRKPTPFMGPALKLTAPKLIPILKNEWYGRISVAAKPIMNRE